jgi:hypothetical protein
MTQLHDRDITLPSASTGLNADEPLPRPPRADLIRDLVGNGTPEAMARQIVESLHQLVHGSHACSHLLPAP